MSCGWENGTHMCLCMCLSLFFHFLQTLLYFQNKYKVGHFLSSKKSLFLERQIKPGLWQRSGGCCDNFCYNRSSCWILINKEAIDPRAKKEGEKMGKETSQNLKNYWSLDSLKSRKLIWITWEENTENKKINWNCLFIILSG